MERYSSAVIFLSRVTSISIVKIDKFTLVSSTFLGSFLTGGGGGGCCGAICGVEAVAAANENRDLKKPCGFSSFLITGARGGGFSVPDV